MSETSGPPTGPAATHGRLSLGGRVATLLGVTVPLAGLVAAVALLWGWGFHWADLGLLLGMYAVTALGITVGFHRLFVHRSFETYLPVKFVLAALGSMAVQGPLFQWVGLHRRHHQHSDTPDDPHSPHHQGGGVLGFLRGFWHAHIGWLFDADPPDLDRYVKDLRSSRALRAASALFPLWVALGLVIPAVLGGLLTGTWAGAWTGLIWGGLVRIFLVHHVTWSVNSACHLWGLRPYRERRREPEQRGVRRPGDGRGVAQHPPRLPDLGPARPALVADRRELLGHPRPGPGRPRLEREAADAGGPAAGAADPPAHHFPGATMKAILSAALAVGLCGLAYAQDPKAEPVGTWKCEYAIGDQKRVSTLVIKK